MEIAVPVLAIAFIAVLAGDGIACAIPIDYIRNDLNRLNCSEQIQRVIPVVKAAAVAGLVIGLWIPLLGVLACVGMIAYFACALAVHRRENDEIVKYLPAVGFMAFTIATLAVSYLPAL